MRSFIFGNMEIHPGATSVTLRMHTTGNDGCVFTYRELSKLAVELEAVAKVGGSAKTIDAVPAPSRTELSDLF